MLLSQEIQRPKRESFAADDFASPPLELARWQRFPLAYLDFIKRLEQERGLLAATAQFLRRRSSPGGNPTDSAPKAAAAALRCPK